MNTTETLGQLHSKSTYWRKVGEPICKMLIGALALVFLITLIENVHLHRPAVILENIAYVIIILLYCIITIRVYQRQEQIFTIYNSDNVKATLKHTITAFKKFYLLFNLVYLFLYPAYYYAVIKLFIPYWHTSTQTIIITSAVATVISLIGGHWYYRVKYLKKIKSLEESLKYLEG